MLSLPLLPSITLQGKRQVPLQLSFCPSIMQEKHSLWSFPVSIFFTAAAFHLYLVSASQLALTLLGQLPWFVAPPTSHLLIAPVIAIKRYSDCYKDTLRNSSQRRRFWSISHKIHKPQAYTASPLLPGRFLTSGLFLTNAELSRV